MSTPVKAARFSIYSNSFLIIIKGISGYLSGSVSIISEAIHSAMDLVASLIAYVSLRIARKPPDGNHPYGHGKYENVSGVIEAILIVIAAVWIIYEAVEKIIHRQEIKSISFGFFVMLSAGIINFFVSRYLYGVARRHDSVALEADALHLKTDVYTSFGVAVGLLIIWITKIYILDPIIAIAVALFIIREAFKLLGKAFYPLTDHALPKKEQDLIQAIILQHIDNYHHFRTRKAGNTKFVDFHVEMFGNISLNAAHAKCDEIEDAIKKKVDNIEVTIHVETK